MGKVTGFLEYDRQEQKYQLAADRVRHFREFTLPLDEHDLSKQAARCMDCGIPFCHGPTGCPVHNQIPDWNDLVYQSDWEEASRNLHSTNNFPEFTGRICPAPCEEACTLNLENQPVAIKTIEQAIADRAWNNGWVKPEPSATRTGKRVAVIGSGPAGMAAAQQLARVGHDVQVYEREPKAGGLLRYGIPDFKMEKRQIEQRLAQMQAEGTRFRAGVEIGVDISWAELRERYDAVVIATGATVPRELPIPGRDLLGVHVAMDYLVQQNKVVAGDTVPEQLTAHGKHVIVIGGGDTGADCIGTAHRQGALSVTNLAIGYQPPTERPAHQPWPMSPTVFEVSSAHEEGGERMFLASTVEFLSNEAGEVRALRVAETEYVDGRRVPKSGTEREIPADLVLIAMGFTGPEQDNLDAQLGLPFDPRGNLVRDGDYATHESGVFVAGDAGRGQSLIVWAIAEGRAVAAAVDRFLEGESQLPAPVRPTDRGFGL